MLLVSDYVCDHTCTCIKIMLVFIKCRYFEDPKLLVSDENLGLENGI